MIEFLGFAILGIGMGTVTGLTPGLHVNNLTPILLGLATGAILSSYQTAAMIVSMMITHTFLDFVPSTFLGVPDEETALSVLPSHKLVLDGRGYEVIELTALGSLGALLFSIIIVGVFTPILGTAYSMIQPHLHWLLLCIVGTMFILEKSLRKAMKSMCIFLVSGILGLIVLDSNLVPGDGALMPLLSGMFGMSVLIISLNSKSSIPTQDTSGSSISIKSSIKPIFSGASAGVVTGVLPGIGPAQGTVLSQAATDSGGTRDFLIGVSGVNTAKALLSFVTLYAIGKPRSGAAVAVEGILEVGLKELVFLTGIALFAGGIATIIHLKIGKIVAHNIDHLPHKHMCVTVMGAIAGLSIFYSGVWGLPILFTATFIGLLPPTLKVKRTHCMGVIILPVMLYFAGF